MWPFEPVNLCARLTSPSNCQQSRIQAQILQSPFINVFHIKLHFGRLRSKYWLSISTNFGSFQSQHSPNLSFVLSHLGGSHEHGVIINSVFKLMSDIPACKTSCLFHYFCYLVLNPNNLFMSPYNFSFMNLIRWKCIVPRQVRQSLKLCTYVLDFKRTKMQLNRN